MSKFKVLQARLPEGQETEAERELRLQIVCDCNPNVSNVHLYNYVADVEAEDLEHVFELMNLWNDEGAVVRKVEKVYSLSVGDIIVSLEDRIVRVWVVARFGFEIVSNEVAWHILRMVIS